MKNTTPLNRQKDTLSLHFSKPKSATASLTVHVFMDHDHFVAYNHALNISAYGDNEKQATDRLFKEVFEDYIENLLALGPDKTTAELKKLGWKRNPLFKKRFTSDSYVDKNGVLKNFNLPEETHIDTQVLTV